MHLRVATYFVAVIGIAITFAAMAHAGGSVRSLADGFTVWAVIPYVMFAAAAVVARTRGAIVAVFIVCLFAVLFASYIYFDALFVHISSTGALVFVFIPLYQLMAAVVVGVFAIERRMHASRCI